MASLDVITCDCPAGIHDRPCWHAAAAFLRHVADSAASSTTLSPAAPARDERCAVCAAAPGTRCSHRPDGHGLAIADLRDAGFTVAA